MFKIGDYVIHPMHGAGIIVEKKDVTVLNEKKSYFVMEPLIEKLNKVMFPVDSVQSLNIRKAISKNVLSEILNDIDEYDVNDGIDDNKSNWNINYKKNMEILKSGNITNIGILCKKLISKNINKAIGTKEDELLSIGKKILLSEILLSFNIDITAANQKLQDIIGKLSSPKVNY